jgi:plastocyanin
MRWTIALAALSIAVLGVAAFSIASGESAQAATTPVNVGNYYICVAADSGHVCETDITAGDTITWSVETGTHHLVQCTDSSFTACPPAGGFDGGNFSQTFSNVFSTAGTFFYHCAIHPTEMMGKVVVAAAVTASPTASPTAAATAAPTVTAAKVPSTGGLPANGGTDPWEYALLARGMTLLADSGLAFAFARKR